MAYACLENLFELTFAPKISDRKIGKVLNGLLDNLKDNFK